MGCGDKIFKLRWLLSGFLPNGHLPRVSRQSRLSANDNCDNEKKPRAVHRDTYLTAEENPSQLQLGNHLMKALQPYFQMTSVGKEKEGRKEIRK